MRIRITRDTVAINRVVTAGEVLDESCGLDPRDAATLIRLGKAVEIQTAPPAEAVDPGSGQAGDSPRPTALTTENAGELVRGKKKKKAPTGLSEIVGRTH
jgi:hypothetical protein